MHTLGFPKRRDIRVEYFKYLFHAVFKRITVDIEHFCGLGHVAAGIDKGLQTFYIFQAATGGIMLMEQENTGVAYAFQAGSLFKDPHYMRQIIVLIGENNIRISQPCPLAHRGLALDIIILEAAKMVKYKTAPAAESQF
jgi:hypothetical protein